MATNSGPNGREGCTMESRKCFAAVGPGNGDVLDEETLENQVGGLDKADFHLGY